MRFEATLAFLCIFEFVLNVHGSVFEEVFAWKQLEYADLPADKGEQNIKILVPVTINLTDYHQLSPI